MTLDEIKWKYRAYFPKYYEDTRCIHLTRPIAVNKFMTFKEDIKRLDTRVDNIKVGRYL